MELKKIPNITIENAQVIFKNFEGRESDFNKEGNRNFGVFLNMDSVESLQRDGWNVKFLKPKEDDPNQFRQPWLSVKVKFDPYPPICQLVTPAGRIRLDESTIGQLDWTDFDRCDLIIRPYNYPATPLRPAGVAAYLKAIYVTPANCFEDKYRDIPIL